MVRILTKDFTELDLTKGFEFQIEMENPMLEEDHIPSAFSTAESGEQEGVRVHAGYVPGAEREKTGGFGVDRGCAVCERDAGV